MMVFRLRFCKLYLSIQLGTEDLQATSAFGFLLDGWHL